MSSDGHFIHQFSYMIWRHAVCVMSRNSWKDSKTMKQLQSDNRCSLQNTARTHLHRYTHIYTAPKQTLFDRVRGKVERERERASYSIDIDHEQCWNATMVRWEINHSKCLQNMSEKEGVWETEGERKIIIFYTTNWIKLHKKNKKTNKNRLSESIIKITAKKKCGK